jgi:hypothetical protein
MTNIFKQYDTMCKFSQLAASYKISQDLSLPLAYLQGFPGECSGNGCRKQEEHWQNTDKGTLRAFLKDPF